MVVVGITVIPGAAVMLGRMVSHHHVLGTENEVKVREIKRVEKPEEPV